MTSSRHEVEKYDSRMVHQNLIRCANILGYPSIAEGVCFGFTLRWIEAVLTNTTRDFSLRLQGVNKVIASHPKNEPLQSDERDINLEAFFDSMILFQDVRISSQILRKRMSQYQISELSEIASSTEMLKQGGLSQSKVLYYGEFCELNLINFLKGLQDKIQATALKNKTIPLMLSLMNKNGDMHATTIIYKAPKWYFMDVNKFIIQGVSSIEELIPQLPFQAYDYFDLRAILAKESMVSFEKIFSEISTIQENLVDLNYIFNLAVKNRDIQAVRKLLEKGADPNTVLKGESVLCTAVFEGHLDIVNALLEKGANPNETVTVLGSTVIFIAIKTGQVNIVKTLLEKDIDLNQRNSDGDKPIVLAANLCKWEIFNELLDKGSNPNEVMTTAGATLIFKAVQCGEMKVIKALLNKGANPNHLTNDGLCALEIAAAKEDWDVVKVLLEKGANPSLLMEFKSTTLLSMASQCGRFDIVQELLEKGVIMSLKRTASSISQENANKDEVDSKRRSIKQ